PALHCAREHREVVKIDVFESGLEAQERPAEPLSQARCRLRFENSFFYNIAKTAGQAVVISPPKGDVINRAAVLAVAGKQFVAALAGEHHFDMRCCELRHEIEWDAGRVGDWLILLIDKRGQRVEELPGSYYDFIMLGCKRLRD